jgi:hypothetical protein
MRLLPTLWCARPWSSGLLEAEQICRRTGEDLGLVFAGQVHQVAEDLFPIGPIRLPGGVCTKPAAVDQPVRAETINQVFDNRPEVPVRVVFFLG